MQEKKIVGKSIAKSDNTYLTTVKLRAKFIQLKKFLIIKEQPQIEKINIDQLKLAINKLQEEITIQKTIINTISEANLQISKDNLKLRNDFKELDKNLVSRLDELVKSAFEELKEISPPGVLKKNAR